MDNRNIVEMCKENATSMGSSGEMSIENATLMYSEMSLCKCITWFSNESPVSFTNSTSDK
jgi:hypothetical protein